MKTPAVVIRQMQEPSGHPPVYQRFPSGPAAIPIGSSLGGCGVGNSVMTPVGVIRPMLLRRCSVNHRLPSGPAVMPQGPLPAVGVGNSAKTPAVVTRPILELSSSVNHRFPSGPAVIPRGSGSKWPRGMRNSVMTPAGVILPILSAYDPSVNHRFPSGPAVMPKGPLKQQLERGNSLIRETAPAGEPIAGSDMKAMPVRSSTILLSLMLMSTSSPQRANRLGPAAVTLVAASTPRCCWRRTP